MQLNNQRFFVLGAEGQLGRAFVKRLSSDRLMFLAPSESHGNICETKEICSQIDSNQSTVVINCAAYNAVDEAESKPELVFEINAKAVARLAKYCSQKNITFVHYSSDYVFDGTRTAPYTEEDQPNPLSCYGRSKWEGERLVLAENPNALIFRLSWVIGEGERNFLFKLRGWAEKNPTLRIAADEVSVPTFTDTIVQFTLLSLENNLKGLYHLTNSGKASRYELAKLFIKEIGLSNDVQPASIADFPAKAVRPKHSVMSNKKLSNALGKEIPFWEESLKQYISYYNLRNNK